MTPSVVREEHARLSGHKKEMLDCIEENFRKDVFGKPGHERVGSALVLGFVF